MIARLAAAALAMLLAGCAVLAPPETPFPQLAAAPRSFEMSGRLAVREGQHSEIAQLRWIRRGASDEWIVSSPLGNEVARIESTPNGATLTRGGDSAEQAETFQELTRRILGVALDPSWLAEGLHGRTPQNLPAGWRFTLDETQPAGAVQLAKRITVSNGDTVVRLVVDSYQPLGD
jgi:outer membrane biogenesis lipoprotein LolB